MANLTYANIETRVANQLRINTGITAEMTKLAALINEIYRDIALHADWWWLTKRQIIATADDITTGTISVTNNSTSVTFSTGPTPSVADRFLYIAGNSTDSGARYRIDAHTAGATAATLDGVYTGATDTAAGYAVYQDTYDLGVDFDRPIALVRYGFPQPMQRVSPAEMLAIKGYDYSVGKPQLYTVFDWETTGTPTQSAASSPSEPQLIIHPYPDAIYRLEMHYRLNLNTELTGTNTQYIPDDYRHMVIYGALARGYPIFLADSERGQFFQNLFDGLLAKMLIRNRQITGDVPQVAPADAHRQFYNRGSRLTPARADLGSYFDRWPVSW